jgi:hypothetical protein
MSKGPSDHSNDPPRKKVVQPPGKPSKKPGAAPGMNQPPIPWKPGNPQFPIPFPPKVPPGPFTKPQAPPTKGNYPGAPAPKAGPTGKGQDPFINPLQQRKPPVGPNPTRFPTQKQRPKPNFGKDL